MRHLPVWVALPAAIGASLGLAGPVWAPLAVAGMLVALAASVAALVRGCAQAVLWRAVGGLLIGAWGLASAAEREARSPALAVAAIPAPAQLEGRLLADALPDAETVRLRLLVTRVDGRDAPEGIASLGVAGSIAQGRWPQWRAGRLVRVPATVHQPARYFDAGVIDDRLGLARRGLVLVGSVKSGALVDVLARGTWLDERAADLRRSVRHAVDRHISARDPLAGAITTAILIGDRTGLDPAIEDRLQRAGTYHVIAISGGNIAIFAATLLLAARAVRLSTRLANPLVVAVLWGYASLVSGGSSVLRATAMASAYLLLGAFDQRAAPFGALSAATAALLIADPLLVADPGFLLTVGATAAILGLTGSLMAWRVWPRGVRTAVAVMAASIATELVLLPVSARLFGRVTFAGPLLNLCAVPAMAVVQQAGAMAVLLSPWSPRSADLAGLVAAGAAEALVRTAGLVDWMPALATRVPAPAWWVVAAYFAFGATALAAPSLEGIRGRRRLRCRQVGAAGTLVMAAWVVWHPATWRAPWRADHRLHVTSLDVGQGDATLIELPDATTVLVDTGGLGIEARFDIGARVVAPAIWARGIGWLDALLLTHGDPDHIGGATTVIDVFEPPQIWDGVVVPSHAPMKALRDQAARSGLHWQLLRAGQQWQRAGVTFNVWNPSDPDWERRKVRNDDSVVLELRYGDVSIVLPGDIGRDVEQDLARRMPPAAFRVLKVPHHGSASSSSDKWLDALRPSIALVSCGRDNRFGHPARTVLARYAARHVQVFRTDRDGEIEFSTDGQTVDVVTYSGRHVTRRVETAHEGTKNTNEESKHEDTKNTKATNKKE